MASEDQVRQYLAYWFQLGKKVLTGNGQETLLPLPVLKGDRYSGEFEDTWRTILSPESGDCYLENTDETIASLLTPEWEVILCARCPMPIPIRTKGMPALSCPCNDLPLWPNTEMPLPRDPVSTQEYLTSLRDRLLKANTENDNKHQILPNLPLELPICQAGSPKQT